MRQLIRITAIFSIAFLLFSGGCDDKKEETTSTENKSNKEKMKITYTFTNYDADWKKVDSLDQQNLPKSALEIVKSIMAQAKKENNQPMQIKALMYQLRYAELLEENSFSNGIATIDSLKKQSTEPMTQILSSMKGELLLSYYQNNRYHFRDRSTTQDFELGDITTWDLKTLVDVAFKSFDASLVNAEFLQTFDLKKFDAILNDKTPVAYETAPTLFDFLAQRALNFFKNDEIAVDRPFDKFHVNDAVYFGTNNAFSSLKIDSEDSLSTTLQYVKVMQKLTQFHTSNNHPIARLRIELKRLAFVHRKATLATKSEVYKTALLKLKDANQTNPVISEVNAAIASLYVDLATNAEPNSPNYKLLAEAHKLCKETIQNYPSARGANSCQLLLSSIEKKEISGQLENVVNPNAPALMKIDFRNLERIYVHVYHSRNSDHTERYYDFNDRIKGLKLISTKEITLPKVDDFHAYSTEIALEPMGIGNYTVVLSEQKTPKNEENTLNWLGEYQVSDLAMSTKDLGTNKTAVQVFNRENGLPIAKATVNVYKSEYNHTVRRYTKKLIEKVTTDANGSAMVTHQVNTYNTTIEVEHGKDVLKSNAYMYRNDHKEMEQFSDELFIDRGIYRPGQTVYFKGIRLSTLNKTSKIVTKQSINATLIDVNYQKVSTLHLTTNEYGSFSGSFQLPTTGLTGQMHIQTEHGSIYFSVEEYKRPTFKVEFDASSAEIKLGASVKVTGKGLAYAGNNVDNADVKYVIKRSASLPYWRSYYYRIAPINQIATIIKEETTKTDENGSFSIDFDALEDPTVKQNGLNYNFEIEVDITDANGETRSAKKSIFIGSTAINLAIKAPALIDVSDKSEIKIAATNAEGKEVETAGTVTISRLKPRPAIGRGRLWEAPTKPLLTETEFKKLFPSIHYAEQNEFEREVAATVVNQSFSTKNGGAIALNTKDWKAGDYRIEAVTKDKFGAEVKDVQIITVTNLKSSEAPFESILSVFNSKDTYQPGETVTIALASSLAKQFIVLETTLDGKINERKFITLNKEQKTFSFPIEEKHRGGFTIYATGVRFGKVVSTATRINVPFSNKELTVSFETFRDILLPGENEEWRLRISGPKKEKVAAELLLTMYDASLDAFASNSFNFAPFRANYDNLSSNFGGFGSTSGQKYGYYRNDWEIPGSIAAPRLNWFGYSINGSGYGYGNGIRSVARLEMAAPTMLSKSANREVATEVLAVVADAEMETSDTAENTQQNVAKTEEKPAALRSNFNETAFFLPQLKTDANGDILVTFKVPESLTSWKILGLAHTKELEYALVQKELITQKELMVQTNMPRFIRTGDEVVITAKVSNITDKETLSGNATIQILDASTMKDVSQAFELETTSQAFNVAAKQSTVVSFKLKAPETSSNLIVRVTAKAANHTDGEELTVPVLTDKVLVTESFPLTNNGKGSKDFEFKKLVNSKESETLKHHAVTLEYTSNPAWYVIQALPYMMEYPYDCAEQTFTRFYANSIASNIVQSSPKIKEVFEQWKNSSPDAFLSNLEKNQQLKSIVLEETPWVLEAQDQNERKKRVALLFDFNKMDNERAKNLRKLEEAQVSNGGFPWFPGMRESRYVTQYIVSGLGHLNQLNIVSIKNDKKVRKMTENAVKYLDARMLEDYQELKKRNLLKDDHYVSQFLVQYLYARSFFNDIKLSKNQQEAFDYFKANAEKNWTKLNLNNQTMFALASQRLGNTVLAKSIMKSIVERSITTEEMGMYWKENERGYYWYQAPIETQSLIIEALYTIQQDQKSVNNAKIWLLRNKQTSDWKTTTATANACYALLIGGSSFTQQSGDVKIEINGKEPNPSDFGAQVEAGTGYFQTTWTGKEISADLGKIKITRETEGFSWGSMYWQYFESMDKVTSAATNLQLKKQLFVVRQTSSGEMIVPVKDGDKLKRGEKIRVRIELSTDRNMEFVHMKDYRAAGFEPINVLSSYKWRNGLGFYENTRDVATHFFFDYLPKGNHVFEYDLRVSHSGNFSNGFATIQCMYAPEFTSHSNGVRVTVE